MASIERTVYPRFPRLLTPHDLQRLFTPSAEDLDWVRANARTDDRQLALMVQLKCFQYLHYFPSLQSARFRLRSSSTSPPAWGCPRSRRSRTPERTGPCTATTRRSASIGVWACEPSAAHALAPTRCASRDACRVVNTRIDVINILISELVRTGYELPAYSALLKIAEQEHEAAEKALYASIEARLSNDQLAGSMSCSLASCRPGRPSTTNSSARRARPPASTSISYWGN